MRPARNKPVHQTRNDKPAIDPDTLQYEWSKGYLPTENPKFEEPDTDDSYK